jgi:hypothetical protein
MAKLSTDRFRLVTRRLWSGRPITPGPPAEDDLDVKHDCVVGCSVAGRLDPSGDTGGCSPG